MDVYMLVLDIDQMDFNYNGVYDNYEKVVGFFDSFDKAVEKANSKSVEEPFDYISEDTVVWESEEKEWDYGYVTYKIKKVELQ